MTTTGNEWLSPNVQHNKHEQNCCLGLNHSNYTEHKIRLATAIQQYRAYRASLSPTPTDRLAAGSKEMHDVHAMYAPFCLVFASFPRQKLTYSEEHVGAVIIPEPAVPPRTLPRRKKDPAVWHKDKQKGNTYIYKKIPQRSANKT